MWSLIRYHTKVPLQSLPLFPFHHFSSSLHLCTYTPESSHILVACVYSFIYFLSFFLSPLTLHLSCLAGEETGGAADFRPQERPIILLKHWGQRDEGKEGRREVRRGKGGGKALTLLTYWPLHRHMLTVSPLNVTPKMAPYRQWLWLFLAQG